MKKTILWATGATLTIISAMIYFAAAARVISPEWLLITILAFPVGLMMMMMERP